MKFFAVIPALVVLVSLCGSPVPLPPGTVTGTIFYDANRNGLHDSCDSPIENAHVVVTGSNGKTSSAGTDATGAFEVKDAPPGDDQVTLLAGQDSIWPITTFAASQTGEPVHVTSSETVAGIEIGSASRAAYIADTVSVSGVIFLDANGNGVVDKDECGLPSASSTMQVAAGGRTAILQSDGSYGMMGLPADTTDSIQVDYSYAGATVGQQTPRQLTPTNGIPGITPCSRNVATTPRYAPTIFEANVGFKEPEAVGTATVNGTVFDDANGNGVRDGGEASVPNVSLYLYGSTGNCGGAKASADVLSDASGNFLVASLPPGHYLADLHTAALGSTIVAWPAMSSRTLTIKEGSNQLEIAVQLIPGASVRVLAFDDTNHNGTQDGGEAPVAGAGFCVVPPAPVCSRTGKDGVAVITPLPAGDYLVEFGVADRAPVNSSSTPPSVHLDAGQSITVPFPLNITTPGSS